MTDRHSGYIITLDHDIREDDAEATINALRMVKGVLSVKPIVHDQAVLIAEERASTEWRDLLYRLYRYARDNHPTSILPEEKP